MPDATTTEADAAAVELAGAVDGLNDAGELSGWLWTPSAPHLRRRVRVFANGAVVGEAAADQPRADLAAAGIGDGAYGFTFCPPAAALSPGAVTLFALRDAATGRQIGPEIAVEGPTAETQAVPAPSDASRTLAGNLDQVTADGWISGWCWYPDAPGERVELLILVDHVPVATTLAAIPRPDLAQAGLGDGRHGFSYALPWQILATRTEITISVRDAATDTPFGAPITLRLAPGRAAEDRVALLERQVRTLRAELAAHARQAQGRDEDRAARALFRSVAAFFHELADAPDGEGFAGAGLRGRIADFTARHDAVTFAIPDRPDATIIVEATASADMAYHTLAAVAATGAHRRADVMVLDHGTQGGEVALLPAIVRNARYHRARPDDAIPAARDDAIRQARGRVVVVLAAGVRPVAGWFEVLLATFDDVPRAAIVAPRLLHADGTIASAGLTLDASLIGQAVGENADPDDPAHRAMGPVDAVDDRGFVVDTAAFAAVGGFDRRFTDPAIALLDLGLALRAAGREILCQPHADLHIPDPVVAPAQGDDGQFHQLREKWPRPPRPVTAGEVLVIDQGLPRADRDAGSVVVIEMMRVLRDLGWRVAVAPVDGVLDDAEAIAALEMRGIAIPRRPHHVSITAYLQAHAKTLDLVLVHRHATARMWIERIRTIAPRARIIFAPADLHHLREAREAALVGGAAPDPELRASEIACVEAADATLLHSDAEIELLARDVARTKLHLLRWIAEPVAIPPVSLGRAGIGFVGGFRHTPNVDAVLWFTEAILPLVRRHRPDAVLHIVGSHTPPRIAALAGAGVVVHGWIADLDAIFAAMRLSVAPLRFGAGFKGKIPTSLARGVPVVATTIAAEGTGLADGEGLSIADDPQHFADAVLRLLNDDAYWATQSARALDRVRALYAPAAAAGVMRNLLEAVGVPG